MSFIVPANETARLAALKQLNILDTGIEKEFDEITRLAALICETPISLISLSDADRQWFKSKIGLDVSEVAREVAFCAQAIISENLFIVPNMLADKRFADNPLVVGTPDIRFYAGVPLVTDEGHALGTLCVLDQIERHLSDAQKEMLQVLGRQVTRLLLTRRQNIGLGEVNQNLSDANRRLSETGRKLERSNRLLAQANEKLGASAESYRMITESASDVIVTIDADSRILFANPATEKVFGYAPAELIGQELSVLIPERMRAAHRAGMKRYLESGIRNIPWGGITLPGLHKSGDELLIEVSFGEHHIDGRHQFTSVMRDITEREAIKAKLKASEERYRFLAETIPQQVWAARRDGFINYGNRRALEYFGGEKMDELSGLQWHQVIHPDDLEAIIKCWARAVETGEPCEAEYRLRRSDGEYRWHLSYAAPMRDPAGDILRWYGTNIDIHDRKLAETAIREAAGYRSLFQHANDAILILDLKTEVVLEANERACQMYGLEHSEFIGMTMRAVSENSAHGDQFRRRLKKAGDHQTFETVQYGANGTPLELLINSSVVDYHGRKVILSINRDVTERNRTERLLTHNALHDALTGLPNRTLFIEHLRHTLDRQTRRFDQLFAVLFLDFDRFKVINDSLGHAEGDNLLIMFANRLKSTVRPADVVARLGGDEFIILLDDLNDPGEAREIAGRIHECLTTPFTLTSSEVVINASIGIALSHADCHDPNDLVRDADIAMYSAKAEGRGRTQVFSQAMHEQANARLEMENELRRAVDRREFSVYYQPIISLTTDRLQGFEALARWRHPERGIVSPLEFISLAEETGLIVPLGEQILRESCAQLRRWQSIDPVSAGWTMSVNLSCKQFLQSNLVECVREILADTGLTASCLRIEVTESYLMEDAAAAIEIMHRLRDLGIKLSIDDFGTGYSSLSYLHRLPLDYLKIDRSFVSRMKPASEDFEIVQTIIALAKNLGLKTIAEGVETEYQSRQLRLFGCDFGQGFLYSKPVPANEIHLSIQNRLNMNSIVTSGQTKLRGE